MKGIRILLGVLGLSVAAFVTSGQEAEDEPESPPPAAEEPVEQAAEEARAVPRGGSDDVFIPTVEVQADEEVVFPVDI